MWQALIQLNEQFPQFQHHFWHQKYTEFSLPQSRWTFMRNTILVSPSAFLPCHFLPGGGIIPYRLRLSPLWWILRSHANYHQYKLRYADPLLGLYLHANWLTEFKIVYIYIFSHCPKRIFQGQVRDIMSIVLGNCNNVMTIQDQADGF